MSRIDEALRRASGTSAEFRAHPVDASSLNRYALEQPPKRASGGPDRAAAAPVAVAPSVAAAPVALPAAVAPNAPLAPVVQVAPVAQVPPAAPAIVTAAKGGWGAAPRAARSGLDFIAPALRDRLVIGDNVPAMSVEQYRRLAASLHELQQQRGLKSLMVSSAVPREGKTLTVSNLALTLSQSFHRRVLLLDADLRRPSIHEVFGLPNKQGLGDVLRAGGGPLPLIEVTPNLAVLPAGRLQADPMALLSSDRAAALIREAAEPYEWVLIDAPPVGLMPDAQLIARMTQAVLFVIAAGSTPHHLVSRSIAELGADRIVGVVLNRVAEPNLPTTRYYQSYYDGTSETHPGQNGGA